MSGAARETLDTKTLQAAFAAVLSRRLERGEPRSAPRHVEPSRCVRRLLDVIHEEVFDPLLSVQILKARCGVHDNNVSSRFRREIGLSIKEYIDRLRLETARQLLLVTESSVFDVCQTVGYYHPQTFYRAFYRSFKCTPREIRNTAEAADCEEPLLC